MADAGTRGTSRVIEAYGAGGFRVDGEAFRGSVIVLPDGVVPWAVDDITAVTLENLHAVLDPLSVRRLPGLGRKLG